MANCLKLLICCSLFITSIYGLPKYRIEIEHIPSGDDGATAKDNGAQKGGNYHINKVVEDDKLLDTLYDLVDEHANEDDILDESQPWNGDDVKPEEEAGPVTVDGKTESPTFSYEPLLTHD